MSNKYIRHAHSNVDATVVDRLVNSKTVPQTHHHSFLFWASLMLGVIVSDNGQAVSITGAAKQKVPQGEYDGVTVLGRK